MGFRIASRLAVVAWDRAAWLLALGLVVVLRYDLALKDDQWLAAVAFTLAAMLLQVAGGFALQLYLGRSRLGSFDEATLLGLLVGGQSLLLGGGFVLFATSVAQSTKGSDVSVSGWYQYTEVVCWDTPMMYCRSRLPS